MLFQNNTHRDIWQQRWCHTCYQTNEAQRRIQDKDTQCPIWERAMKSGRKPKEWDRATRDSTMEKSIKCNEYTSKPPKTKQYQSFQDVPLFDETPYKIDVGYVPVEGWPEPPKQGGVDHA